MANANAKERKALLESVVQEHEVVKLLHVLRDKEHTILKMILIKKPSYRTGENHFGILFLISFLPKDYRLFSLDLNTLWRYVFDLIHEDQLHL